MKLEVQIGLCAFAFIPSLACSSTPGENVRRGSAAVSVSAGGVYTLGTLAHAGSCLDARSAGMADGTQIQEWTCNGTGAQSYSVTNLGNGAVSLENTNAAKCIDIYQGGSADGTKVELWDCNGGLGQTFVLQDAGNGNFRIFNPSSNKCLDVDADNPNSGTVVQLWDCNGGNNQAWSVTATTANPHQVYGEEILDRIIADNYDANTQLYAEQITTATLAPSSDSFLWSATHLLRALMWGAMVDPAKYQARLESYAGAIPRYYQSGSACYQAPGCYGSSTGGGTPYFDDNALLDSALTDIYQKIYPNANVLNMAVTAFNYDMAARDAEWTVPQVTSQLGQGLIFSMATTPTGLSAARLAEITGNSTYSYDATTWYNIFTDVNVKMMDQTRLLLNQGSFYWSNDPNADGIWSITNLNGGTWSLEKQGDPNSNVRGFRAYQTSYVIELAVKLYTGTHDAAYLQEAQAIASSVLKTWYTAGAGFSEISFWGGNDSIDAIMDLHNVDPDPKWLAAAQDIVNFIINDARDTSGYYPNGASNVGAWNLVRTGTATPGTVDMMSQAAAANAILRVAWCEQNAACASP